MRFDTVTFWLFFAVAWSVWRFAPFAAAKRAALLLSLLFYGWWNPWYLLLIVASTVVDFVASGRIHACRAPSTRRAWLLLSLCSNLGLLATFKYLPFLASNASSLARLAGFEIDWELAGWVIPVGISFYTFQTLSYTIDIYRGQIAPAPSFSDFFLFVAFFPQLVAGPIVRAKELLPQFARRRRLLPVAVQTGLYYCIQGLFLKIVVADNLAPAVEHVFDTARLAELSPTEVWLGVVYFSFQIFADFAGYSGIAIGLAYLMGLRFPLNFLYPYIARGPSEFWRRWHISLSQWLRDYLYIPLGGNRRGWARTYANLMTTMLLGGLWHGAAWTFVVWGGLHGLALCVERVLRREPVTQGPPRGPLGVAAALAQMLVFFAFLQVTWVFFRATSFEMAWQVLGRMFRAPFGEGAGLADLAQARHLVLLLPVLALSLGQLAHEWFGLRKGTYLRASAAAFMLFCLVVVSRRVSTEFLYFQF